jgi:hypothetical protein
MTASNNRKDTRKKRPQLTIYFESADQVDFVKKAAGGNVSRYCTERILLSKGFRDPIFSASARLLGAANAINQDLHKSADVVRAVTALTLALREIDMKDAGMKSHLLALVAKSNEAITELLSSCAERSDIDSEIIAAAREVMRLLSDRETSSRPSSATEWDRPKK